MEKEKPKWRHKTTSTVKMMKKRWRTSARGRTLRNCSCTEGEKDTAWPSTRARLPDGGRKKASKELEINVEIGDQQTGARHERVSSKMIRAMAKQMYATMTAEMRSLPRVLVD